MFSVDVGRAVRACQTAQAHERAQRFLVLPPRTPLDTHCRLRVFAGENLVAETQLAAKDEWDAVDSFELKLSATSGSWVLTAARIINW